MTPGREIFLRELSDHIDGMTNGSVILIRKCDDNFQVVTMDGGISNTGHGGTVEEAWSDEL